ncbi:MAG: acyl-CoA/acyl-ACP dehydrogenase [Pseudomonadales bacterium]|nr:acyl-CoA/acyl-ACP dehydrogenase [Pseudomonadales bacterium]
MNLERNFNQILSEIDEIGVNFVAPNADDVDKQARFPDEAFSALKKSKLLSVYIPKELGGEGLSVKQVSQICERLAHYCSSTALIYAMHQSQVACLIHHAFESSTLIDALCKIANDQALLASSTTETNTGGDLRSSSCAMSQKGDQFFIEKSASVLSYGEKADVILITCKKSDDSAEKDQVLVLAERENCNLAKLTEWDTLGLRGTCSSGFNLKARGPVGNVFPPEFSKILMDTMQPLSHIFWSSVWLGIAASVVEITRRNVVNAFNNQKKGADFQTKRFAELDANLCSMRSNLTQVILDYELIRAKPSITADEQMSFSITVNNLKINSSRYLVKIVSDAMINTGISSYSVNSDNSLCRQLRDAYGAPLMVSNDRLLDNNSTLLLI